jgi:hypothetical protein
MRFQISCYKSKIWHLFGDIFIMTTQAKPISIEAIGDQMMKRMETVAVAESVTAGQLQQLFSTIPH